MQFLSDWVMVCVFLDVTRLFQTAVVWPLCQYVLKMLAEAVGAGGQEDFKNLIVQGDGPSYGIYEHCIYIECEKSKISSF